MVLHLTPNQEKSVFVWDPSTDEVLPKDAQYDFLYIRDTLSPILPNQLPHNIKSLELIQYDQPLVLGSLPFEILELSTIKPKFVIERVIPSFTKNLFLYSSEYGKSIPFDTKSINSVESLCW
ncbi:hypothetical protein PPL_01338 [Heterostelium album PN500]|uniref:Uncharacterized protein n=1 Tax=Heterostelium pallidum (strain ATCC 26659 / Pp 5 / PN500) TaxID=670386 RepID=D3AYS4_HETP5|nr:hypothetical protein PPL_01338 [Heterostelium album PN500]EFA86101.1 hypothetical protein PPL_01338 [Heterostelium album PN500]|eukprot:XP_020438207.1 hypothetical protein PPL_01338 [Heterostelium album PN500]